MIEEIVGALAAGPEVHVIALGGSRTSSIADPESDYDVYVFLDGAVPLDTRESLARRFDPAPEIGNSWFGPGDQWTDAATGTSVDLMYWQREDFERDLRDVIEGHRPSLGYSTAFWYTVCHATPLYDRARWFGGLQALAARPYPEALREAIVAFNHPLLRTTHSSWRHQIELAIARDDPVSVNHRLAALLTSVFDMVFASVRAPHPGEKRLLDHVARLGDPVPDGFGPLIRRVLAATSDPVDRGLVPAIDELCDVVDEIVRRTDPG